MDTHVTYVSQILDVPICRLYMLSNDTNAYGNHRKKNYYRNYHRVVLKKPQSAKIRVLTVPNGFLKTVQRRILNRILHQLPVSSYATAYQKGKSLRDNALPHVNKEMVVKLDIAQFFDHINGDMVFGVMQQLKFSECATVLLTHLCIYQDKLPQGAPTSPYLANLVMRHFDEKIGAWCSERSIQYTRYCDDMTFSGTRDAIMQSHLISYVRKKLYPLGFSLNEQKTAMISDAQQQRVTGVVVNDKAAIPRTLRRKLRQEVYYCCQYGVSESLRHRGDDTDPTAYLHRLLGRIAYAKQIDPTDQEMQNLFTRVLHLAREASEE